MEIFVSNEREQDTSYNFIEVHRSLSRFGRFKCLKNPIKLIYMILSSMLADCVDEIETTRESLARWAGVSPNTIDCWIKMAKFYGVLGSRRTQHGIILWVPDIGKQFINFLRDDVPLCITPRKQGRKCSAVTQAVIQDSPTLYTDHLNSKSEEILFGKPDSVDNPPDEAKRPVIETDHVDEVVMHIQAKQDSKKLPPINRHNIESFVRVLAKERISVETFLFAYQTYLSCDVNFGVHSPLGFILDQCVKDRDVCRQVFPEPIDDKASEIAAEMMRGLTFSEPTIEDFDRAFNTVREALKCNQYN